MVDQLNIAHSFRSI